MTQASVIVIGAGVVGISIALELQRRGYSVRVLDRDGVAAQASAGNAGAFAFSEIEPLATPGIMRKAPKWFLDPMGPLAVPPAYAVQIMPWLWKFLRASQRSQYAHLLAAQVDLMRVSKAGFDRLATSVDAEDLLQRDGQLQLYESEAEYRASLSAWELRRHHGIAFDLLQSPEAIAEIQPGLSKRFTHAGFTPNWINVVDPKAWVDHLAQVFRDRGGQIDRQEVRAIVPAQPGVRLTLSSGEVEASKVVIAAGAWSHHLARGMGDLVPLETERGYNTTLPPGAFDLRLHLTFSRHGFVASRINGGVRVGGAVELGGLKLPPNFKRADTLLDKARDFLPGLDTQRAAQWMGFRPSLPDSLPVIGPSPASRDVIYAFGHGHLGLTQSAGTAELVADVIEGRASAISLEPFLATRF